MEEQVILVDSFDQQIGLMPKMEAHEKGMLHRAFSVFVMNDKGELLLQQRAFSKYHSPGLWSNTCCSHPRDGEAVLAAAQRRLEEEMGMSCDLKPIFSFIYQTVFDNGLTEHEYDHVLVGYSNLQPVLNENEVNASKWVGLDRLAVDLKKNPQDYTAWFQIIFERFKSYIDASHG